MAHEMETGKDYMVSAGNKVPWHKIGAVLSDKAITAAVAVKEARLDWGVERESVFDGEAVDLEAFRLLRRSDTKEVLSIVNEDWTPLQNLQLLEIAEALAQAPGVDDFKPVIETAGSLRGGKVVYALVQTGLRTFAGSEHKQYFLLSNGHYMGRGVRGTLTDVRVVCANTLGAAENAAASLFTTHSGNVTQRIEDAIKALGWATEATRSTFAIYDALLAKPFDIDQSAKFFESLLLKKGQEKLTDKGSDNVIEMVTLFRSGAGNEGKTLFDAVNAVTDWVDHSKTFRETDTTDERRFMDVAIAGNGASLKKKALKLAFAMTK